MNTLENVYYGLRSKQKETFDICQKEKFGIIKDTCGTGKSRIEFELICQAIENNKKIIIFAAHRLDLIKQHEDNFNNYIKEFHQNLIDTYHSIEISSAKRNEISSTTTISTIRNIIDGIQKTTIFFTCYASLDKLYQAINGRKNIDLMLCDEAHYGESSIKENGNEFDKYKFINISNSFLCFTATPYKETMTSDKMKIIHDYSYSEAVEDNLILPMHVEFYRGKNGEYDEHTKYSMIKESYKNLKMNFLNTAAKLLVCGTGLEENQICFNSLINDENIQEEINNGNLAIVKVGSSSMTSDNEEIPSCEFVDFTNCKNYISGNGKIDIDNDNENKIKVIQKIHDWTENEGNEHHNIIIIHCQMLGVGIDLPNLNGICILGNKEVSDFYQSIMRGCRIAKFDRNKSPSDRLETYFKVYIHCYDDINKQLEVFIDKLFTIGKIDLLKSVIFSNELTSSINEAVDINTMAKELLNKTIKEKEIEFQKEIDYQNIKTNFENLINEFKTHPTIEFLIKILYKKTKILSENYPEYNSFIWKQIAECEDML